MINSLPLRPHDRISYRSSTTWRTAKVLHVKTDGVIAADVSEKAIVRLGWDEVYPPF